MKYFISILLLLSIVIIVFFSKKHLNETKHIGHWKGLDKRGNTVFLNLDNKGKAVFKSLKGNEDTDSSSFNIQTSYQINYNNKLTEFLLEINTGATPYSEKNFKGKIIFDEPNKMTIFMGDVNELDLQEFKYTNSLSSEYLKFERIKN